MIAVFGIMFVVVVAIAIMWANGIEKNKDIDKDDIEFP
jgi:hypothetical protein